MARVNRRTLLGALAAGPLAGGVVARASSRGDNKSREARRARYFPNVELTTHEGKKVRFYDDLIKNKIVVINFMYADCEGICPTITTNLVKAQKLLGDRMGRNIFMYSLTLSPEKDTPEALKHYAKMHGVKPGWTFLTGKPEDVETLRRSLGFSTGNLKLDKDKTNHIGMVKYGNERREWWGMVPGKAKPGWIVESILWMDDTKESNPQPNHKQQTVETCFKAKEDKMKQNPDARRGLFIALFLAVAAVLAPGISISRAQQATGDGLQMATTRSKSFRVVGGPDALAFDGASIWVASHISNTVTKLRAKDGVELGKFDVGQRPVALAFDRSNIWVANLFENTVMKLRASDGLVLGTYRVGKQPTALLFDGANVWVVNKRSGTVTKLRASDGSKLGTFKVGSSPMAIAYDGANIWVTNNGAGSVTKLRASDGEVLGTFNAGSRPIGIAFDGHKIWVANFYGSSLTRLQANDGAILDTYPVQDGPSGVTFAGGYIWVSNYGASTVSKIEPRDGSLVSSFVVGKGPSPVLFDGRNIWIASSGSNSVLKVSQKKDPPSEK